MEPLRDQSGLAANSVSFWQVMAQGLIANGPLAATTVALTAAASYALGALPLAYILGIVVVVLWVNTPWQFSKRLASASGVAYFVYQSMGGAYGYLAGLSYGTYYLALIPANALFFGVMIPALLPLVGIAHPAVWLWMPLSAAFLIPPLVITYRGIRTSLNYAIIIALTEVLLLLVVSLVIIAGAGAHNTTAVFNPGLAAGGMSGFAVGLLVAAFGMSGSTATVYLGSEARVPTETIRKGLIYSTLIVVVLFVLVSYAMTVGWGYQKMGQFAGANIPGLEVVQHYLGTVPELILGLFVINSLIGVNMAASIVVSRILMTFGRAGLMPTGWGQVHPVFKTPHQATVVLTVGAFLLGVVSAIVWGPSTGFIVLILLATMGEFLGHIFGNIALPLFYQKRGGLRTLVHVAIPALSLLTILAGVFYTFYPISVPFVYAAAFMLLILVVGAAQYRWFQSQPDSRARARRVWDSLGTDTGELAAHTEGVSL